MRHIYLGRGGICTWVGTAYVWYVPTWVGEAYETGTKLVITKLIITKLIRYKIDTWVGAAYKPG